MSQITLIFTADNKPDNLPSPDVIVQQCRAARASIKAANANSSSSDLPGVPVIDESPGGAVCAWVKSGRTVTMHEAQVQHFVGQAINGKADAAVRIPAVYLAFQRGAIGYLVMEYIDGSGPTGAPGPVGQGPIKHRFFCDWESSMVYESVKVLETHINRILAYMGSKERVSFESEVEEDGLPLCPCDLNRTNFMRDRWGKIVAVDFGASCFLPRSFFDFALYQGDGFAQLLLDLLQRPQSAQLSAMLTAQSTLVVHGTNKIGKHASLLFFFFLSFFIPWQ
ncbi:hypothetical protein AX16_009892, partial [Volvariella volvacea WC 439]